MFEFLLRVCWVGTIVWAGQVPHDRDRVLDGREAPYQCWFFDLHVPRTRWITSLALLLSNTTTGKHGATQQISLSPLLGKQFLSVVLLSCPSLCHSDFLENGLHPEINICALNLKPDFNG